MKMIKSEYKKLSSTHKIKTCTYNKLEKHKFSFLIIHSWGPEMTHENLSFLLNHHFQIFWLKLIPFKFINGQFWSKILYWNRKLRFLTKNIHFELKSLRFRNARFCLKKIRYEFRTYESIRNERVIILIMTQ